MGCKEIMVAGTTWDNTAILKVNSSITYANLDLAHVPQMHLKQVISGGYLSATGREGHTVGLLPPPLHQVAGSCEE